MAWRVFAAAAIGKSHIDLGTPCQDAHAHQVVGQTLVAVVCDGAGSQPLSHLGAQAISLQVVQALAGHEAHGDGLVALPPEVFHAAVAGVIDAVRDALGERAAAAGVALSSYSATLVGVVAGEAGGYFFQIGDGLGAADPTLPDQAGTFSLPENGEYANETYFVSGAEWREHLRITAIPRAARTIALMSDGAMPFVMAKGNTGLFRPFMDPVTQYLATASADEGNQALAGTLEDPRTYGITGDDKTLLVALWQ